MHGIWSIKYICANVVVLVFLFSLANMLPIDSWNQVCLIHIGGYKRDFRVTKGFK